MSKFGIRICDEDRGCDDGSFFFFRRVITPLLFGGLVLDALVRVGFQLPRIVLWGVLVVAVIAWRYAFPLAVPSRRIVTGSFFMATALAVCLVLADLIRLSHEPGGLSSIFASRVLYHEDNSSWIALGSFSSAQGIPSGKFGHQLSILYALSRTAASAIGWLVGVEVGSWGVSVAAVTLSYVGLLAITPFLVVPMFRLVRLRTRSMTTSTLVALFFLILLIGFIREVRNLGHLSAGVAVVLFVASVLFLLSRRLEHARSMASQIEPLLILAVMLHVWFPLQPLGFLLSIAAIILTWRVGHFDGKKNVRCWLRLAVLPAPIIVVLVFRYAKVLVQSGVGGSGYYAQLLSLPGATYETYDSLLILLAIFIGLAFFGVGERENFALSVGVAILLYGVAVRFADAAVSLGFDYGSTKLLWVIFPPMIFLFFGVFVSVNDQYSSSKSRRVILGTTLPAFVILLNSTTFFHAVRSFQPFIPFGDQTSFLELEGDGLENESSEDPSLFRWDELGGVAIGLSPTELPISCIATDGVGPTPRWGFEPYRCTRKLAEASLVQGIQRESEGPPVDILLRRFPLLQASLTETVMGLVGSGNDLSRELLILDQSGGVIRTERILDFLVQVTSYRELIIESLPSDPGSAWTRESDLLQGNIDRVDLDNGTLTGWVDPSVTSLSLIGSDRGEVLAVRRTERDDVAQQLGAGRRYSGFSFTSRQINPGLRCVVAHSSAAEYRILWRAEKSSC